MFWCDGGPSRSRETGVMAESQKKRILIVEDEEPVAMVLKMRLELEGFEVHAEACGAMALRYAEARRPDLVVLDLRLPDIGGYEVCRKLRIMYRPWSIPVLMLTGMDRPIDQLRGFAHGADAYMTKPYNGKELVKTITLLLEQQAVATVAT